MSKGKAKFIIGERVLMKFRSRYLTVKSVYWLRHPDEFFYRLEDESGNTFDAYECELKSLYFPE